MDMKLSRHARKLFNNFVGRFVEFLANHNVNPNSLTLLGLLLISVSTYFYMTHSFIYAGLFLTMGAFMDGVDGAVARRLGRAGGMGAFIDSTVDRVEDSIIAIGILLTNLVNPLYVILMLATSMMVSYTRARAEGLGVEMSGVGIAERWLRLILLIVATFITTLSPTALEVAVIIVIILSSITVVQRTIYSIRMLRPK